MKTLNRIFQILCIACGLAVLVLFFFNFVTIVGAKPGTSESLVGTVLAFGGKTKGIVADERNMAISSRILLGLILAVIGFVMSIFSFKKKGLRYAVPVVALGDAVFMLVIALVPGYLVDLSAFSIGSEIVSYSYTPIVWILIALLFAFAVFAAAYLFLDDYIEVTENKGKKTILQRLGLFFRDYKSEIKKIVWPNFSDVLKNTIIVLVMCLLVGAFIWLLDWGLGSLIKLILNTQS